MTLSCCSLCCTLYLALKHSKWTKTSRCWSAPSLQTAFLIMRQFKSHLSHDPGSGYFAFFFFKLLFFHFIYSDSYVHVWYSNARADTDILLCKQEIESLWPEVTHFDDNCEEEEAPGGALLLKRQEPQLNQRQWAAHPTRGRWLRYTNSAPGAWEQPTRDHRFLSLISAVDSYSWTLTSLTPLLCVISSFRWENYMYSSMNLLPIFFWIHRFEKDPTYCTKMEFICALKNFLHINFFLLK